MIAGARGLAGQIVTSLRWWGGGVTVIRRVGGKIEERLDGPAVVLQGVGALARGLLLDEESRRRELFRPARSAACPLQQRFR